MSYEPPTPPNALPTALVDQVEELSDVELRQLATYVDALIEYREREARLEEADDAATDDIDDDTPDGVPSKASLVTKTINDNQYYYWQWREGDTVKSKYHAPVSPDE